MTRKGDKWLSPPLFFLLNGQEYHFVWYTNVGSWVYCVFSKMFLVRTTVDQSTLRTDKYQTSYSSRISRWPDTWRQSDVSWRRIWRDNKVIKDHVKTTRISSGSGNFWINSLRSENRVRTVTYLFSSGGRGGRCTKFEVSRVLCGERQGGRDGSHLSPQWVPIPPPFFFGSY